MQYTFFEVVPESCAFSHKISWDDDRADNFCGDNLSIDSKCGLAGEGSSSKGPPASEGVPGERWGPVRTPFGSTAVLRMVPHGRLHMFWLRVSPEQG